MPPPLARATSSPVAGGARRHGPRRAWSSSSARNTRTALASIRATPSGCRQAPRPPPTIVDPARETLAVAGRGRRPSAKRSTTPASAAEAVDARAALPGWTARRRYAVSRAVSATGHADAPSTTTTPAPTAAPWARSDASSSARPAASCATQRAEVAADEQRADGLVGPAGEIEQLAPCAMPAGTS